MSVLREKISNSREDLFLFFHGSLFIKVKDSDGLVCFFLWGCFVTLDTVFFK